MLIVLVRFFNYLLLIAVSVFISGCGASVSTRWKDDASARFNTVIAAGGESFAPEESDNIRQTIALADRYFKSSMFDDADRLYQLSCQKTQLLYRNLVVSKINKGATIVVEENGGKKENELLVAEAPVSLKQLVEELKDDEDDTVEATDTIASATPEEDRLPAARPEITEERSALQARAVEPAPQKEEKPASAVTEEQIALQARAVEPAPQKEEKPASAVKEEQSALQARAVEPAPQKEEKPASAVTEEQIAPQARAVEPVSQREEKPVRVATEEQVILKAPVVAATPPKDEKQINIVPPKTVLPKPPVFAVAHSKNEKQKTVNNKEQTVTIASPLKPAAHKPPVTAEKTARINIVSSLPAKSPKGTTLYLTFDDGPSRLTIPIASYLASQGVKATFFALGSNIKGREKTVSSVLEMGHRVGNHTLSHNLKKLNASLASSNNEIRRTADMIEKLGGDGKLVRIPYGAVNKSLATNAAAEGAQIVDWDINSNDSTRSGVKNHQVIERTVLRHLQKTKKRHLVLLFHDGAGHDSTLAAIKSLIPKLKQEGYGFGLLARNETVAASTAASKKHTP